MDRAEMLQRYLDYTLGEGESHIYRKVVIKNLKDGIEIEENITFGDNYGD